jgi:multiple sugar transport system substrate-binding protein
VNPLTIKGITWQNPRGHDPLVAAAALWQKQRPAVRIEWTQQPWYEFENTILRSLAAGDGAFDFIMFDHPWTGKLAQEKWLVPWDELAEPSYIAELRRRVVPPSLESYELDGHLWGLPLDGACHAALYREDLVDIRTVPGTWEELRTWARAFRNPDGRSPLVLLVEGVLGHCLFLSVLAGLGHPAYLDEENPTCDRAAAEYALTLLRDLLSYCPPGSTHWGPWDIYDHLCTHDDVGYSPSIFAYVNYFTLPERGRLLRLGQVPSFAGKGPGRAILGGVGLGLARTFRHREAAVEHAIYLMSDDVQRDIFPAHSGQPAASAAWDDSTLNFQTNGFYAALKGNMAHAYIRPRYPSFHRLELDGGRALQRWWDNDASLEETLRAVRAA